MQKRISSTTSKAITALIGGTDAFNELCTNVQTGAKLYEVEAINDRSKTVAVFMAHRQDMLSTIKRIADNKHLDHVSYVTDIVRYEHLLMPVEAVEVAYQHLIDGTDINSLPAPFAEDCSIVQYHIFLDVLLRAIYYVNAKRMQTKKPQL